MYAIRALVLVAAEADRVQIYRTPDKPFYFTGNKVLIGITCYNVCVFLFAKVFYVTVNR